MLRVNHYQKIYISHYDDDRPARKLGRLLQEQGFEVTIASDARKLGIDFVSKKIQDSDLTVVVNPEKPEARLLLEYAGKVYSLEVTD